MSSTRCQSKPWPPSSRACGTRLAGAVQAEAGGREPVRRRRGRTDRDGALAVEDDHFAVFDPYVPDFRREEEFLLVRRGVKKPADSPVQRELRDRQRAKFPAHLLKLQIAILHELPPFYQQRKILSV